MNFYQISPIVNESRTHTKLTLLKLKINNWYLLSPGYEYVTLTILLIVWYFEYLYLLSLASGCVIVSDYFCWYVVILLFFLFIRKFPLIHQVLFAAGYITEYTYLLTNIWNSAIFFRSVAASTLTGLVLGGFDWLRFWVDLTGFDL